MRFGDGGREQALSLFGRARGIYDRLHDIAGDVHKPLYLQVPLWLDGVVCVILGQRVDEINASLRYCAHSLGVSDIAQLLRVCPIP